MNTSLRVRTLGVLAAGVGSLALASASGMPPVLRVTINPEARVSVEAVGPVPTVRCGGRVSLTLEVINESLGTQSLQVQVLSDGARVASPPLAPLTGAERESREIVLLLESAHPVDITLEFDAGPGTDDLGGRSRTHLYAACMSGTA